MFSDQTLLSAPELQALVFQPDLARTRNLTDRCLSQRVADCVRRITLQDIWKIPTPVQQAEPDTFSPFADPLIAPNRFSHATDLASDNTIISDPFSLDDRGTWMRALPRIRG